MVNGGPPTPDVVEVLRHLERGLVTTIFFYRKKPERRTLRVKLETRQLQWIKAQGARPEGAGRPDRKTGQNWFEFQYTKPNKLRLEMCVCVCVCVCACVCVALVVVQMNSALAFTVGVI